MFRRGLTLGLFLFSSSLLANHWEWTLRFDEERAHPSFLTGCIGTASYDYTLPSLEELKAYRLALQKMGEQVQNDSFAWSRTPVPNAEEHVYGLSLADGTEISLDKQGGEKGLVFCKCKYQSLKNCSRSAVPPLGRPFTAKAQSTGVEITETSWTDPLTGNTFTYASPGMNWKSAKESCGSRGLTLPTLEQAQVAQKRMVNSSVGWSVLQAHPMMWTSTPIGKEIGDPYFDKAWAMYIESGNAGGVAYANPLPVVCMDAVAN